jgi:amidophosphoribosyltransferase
MNNNLHEESGIPYGEGLIKNHYIGRTFIQSDQDKRVRDVKIKLNVLASSVKGKRIVMVDDSIVRGNTIARIIQMLKEAGASEVHVRISFPPFKWPCYFGTDIPSKKQLIACHHTIDEIGELFKANSIAYLSLPGLMKITKMKKCSCCNGCFSGDYPMEVPEEVDKLILEKVI